jgi:TonB family protein
MNTELKKAAIWVLCLACLVLFGLSGPQETAKQAGKADPVKAVGDIKPPKLLKSVSPVYPEKPRKEGIEGTVILEATADAKGLVENVKVVRSVPALDQAAIDAVKQWVYEPMLIDGKARPVVFTVTVRFTLDKDKPDKKSVAEAVEGSVARGKPAETEKGAVRAKDGIEPPKLIKMVEPVYPEQARKEGIEGVVILEATVDIQGSVESVKVLHSIPALDQAAIDAVKQWVYEPLILDGKPRPVIFTVTVKFTLK